MIFQQVTGKNAIAWKNPFHFQHQLFSFVGMELALKINHYSIQASAIGNTQCAYWWFVLFDALYFNWYFPNFSFTHWYFPNSINFFFSRKTIETNDLSKQHTMCTTLINGIYLLFFNLPWFFSPFAFSLTLSLSVQWNETRWINSCATCRLSHCIDDNAYPIE